MLRGVNAAVVGLLLAALYHPVWTSAITSTGDFLLGAAAFLLLFMWKTPMASRHILRDRRRGAAAVAARPLSRRGYKGNSASRTRSTDCMSSLP
jgi:protein-S-isoprenylcysteine O-methyltransferase Ste14